MFKRRGVGVEIQVVNFRIFVQFHFLCVVRLLSTDQSLLRNTWPKRELVHGQYIYVHIVIYS